ncbi:hypothetical protein IC757_06460 [Wenzhouxiangella sp. AB-CW3]|uniref:hypothetical protein n=1 Tax=Wenzhouxiangella sp. AB-CW3 TaxID=2771012 RepID=UPI00168A793B|nr:hypothetical protein [Wenzhouxiangella sp. AB-CW3]QOC23764.1 hypothetical protein IC757_06460 [Wenzhouxiangella sp. AB-CW3]
MNRSEIQKFQLEPAKRECELHLKRLDYAADKLAGLIPVDSAQWMELDEETIASIDQLLFRFVKLQDAVGRRLFPSILKVVEEWDETEPFIDKLNRLEKLGVLESAVQWSELRELRNRATHEYPDSPEQNAANLNLVFEALSELRQILETALKYSERYVSA